MNKIFKICLILALFFATASVALASLNYDSANNIFLIDSLLKIGGNHFLVGDGLSGYCSNSNYISQSQCEANGSTWHAVLSKLNVDGTLTESNTFFAVSNNLVFWQNEGLFTSSDGVRQMGTRQKGGKIESFLKTNSILVNSSDHNFQLLSPLSAALNFIVPQIKMNQNLVINKGLSFDPSQQIFDNTIYVNKVLTNNLQLLQASDIVIKSGTKLTIAQGAAASANDITDRIKINNQPFCKIITWDIVDNSNHRPANPAQDIVSVHSCDTNYFVFNLDVDNGKMVCCRAATGNN